MTGFEFPYGTKTVFVKTTREKKTKNLARKILQKMLLPDGRVEELLYWLRKANCEIRTTESGMEFYSISGKGFTECGPLDQLEIIHII